MIYALLNLFAVLLILVIQALEMITSTPITHALHLPKQMSPPSSKTVQMSL